MSAPATGHSKILMRAASGSRGTRPRRYGVAAFIAVLLVAVATVFGGAAPAGAADTPNEDVAITNATAVVHDGFEVTISLDYALTGLNAQGWLCIGTEEKCVDELLVTGPGHYSSTFTWPTPGTYNLQAASSFDGLDQKYRAGHNIGTVLFPSGSVDRISGADRYATAVAISEAGHVESAPVVYLATGTNFPDALAAAPAAVKEGGPLLLTLPTSLPPAVKAEIQRLRPETIVVVGGEAAVSAEVLTQLTTLAASVVRVAGADRFETARKVVARAFPVAVPSVYIATALNYPDALSASAAAGATGNPVVLVDGSAPTLDSATKTLLGSLGATSFKIAGGTAAVSTGIEADLTQIGAVARLGGADRLATSELINLDAGTSLKHVYFATGYQFPDALAGAALAGAAKAPLFLVPPSCVPDSILWAMTGAYPLHVTTSQVTLFGGTSALSPAVAELRSC